MGLESATYISDLVITNPTGLDPKRQGDDHLRLIKSTLQNTFPNVTGSLNLTQAQVNNAAIKIEENTFTQNNFVSSGKAWVFGSTTTGSPFGLGSPVGSPRQTGLLVYNDGDGHILNMTGHLNIQTKNLDLLIDSRNLDVSRFGLSIKNDSYLRVHDGGGDFLDVTHNGTDIVFTSAGTDSGSANISFDNVVRFESDMYIAEQTPGADKTGYGQLFCEHGSPRTEVWGDHTILKFIDDTGDETQIGTSYKLLTLQPVNGFGSPSPKTTIFLAKTGELVRMFFNITVSATSTTTEMSFDNFTIPQGWRPAGESNFLIPIIDNGVVDIGQMQVKSNGGIEFQSHTDLRPNIANTFTASGTKGFYNNTPVIWHTTAGNT